MIQEDSRDSNGRKNMTPLITYVLALRPWSFSASFVPVLLGNMMAYQRNYLLFSPVLCVLTMLCVLAVHSGGNLTNTYCDFKNGVDKETSDDKTLVNKMLGPHVVYQMSIVAYVVGLMAFLLILDLSRASSGVLVTLFLIGLSGSFLYTGSIALKYLALGDIVIILMFGPLSVLSPYVVQTGELSWMPILFSIPIVLHTEAILHSNNARDRVDDERAGIKTLALILGRDFSYHLQCLLLFLPYVFSIVLCFVKSFYFSLTLASAKLAFDIVQEFRCNRLSELPQQTAKLNLLFGVLYITGFLL